MALKRLLLIFTVAVFAIAGIYLIIVSGQVHVDLYSLVLFLIVGALMVYLYLLFGRPNE